MKERERERDYKMSVSKRGVAHLHIQTTAQFTPDHWA